ncbi:MAG: hypothetical protein U5N56_03095 [Candidatus Marinimicrobia bacterium]|nr:hypothetical protein [Candidatus Neomarinimicrobiota bacterium]
MMKKKFFLLMCIFIGGSLEASDTLFFDVSLLGIRVAGVEITENQLADGAAEIVYHAFTVGAFDKIYDTDNWYHYYTSPEGRGLDSLKKYIHQDDFVQYYAEYYEDGEVRYSTGHVNPARGPVHHVLSFLVYLQNTPSALEREGEYSCLISDEGELLRPSLRIEENADKNQKEVRFSFRKIGGKELLESTDVFNWMVCADNGERMLAYSNSDNTITEGRFSIGWGLRLRARRR